jgi:anti-anti-sigma factor
MGVKINERSVDALTSIVELEGELDLYAAAPLNASLMRAIDEQKCLRLVVDLREVSAIDFSTIAILSQNARALSYRHGTLEVVCNDDEIARLLSKAGESGRFEVRIDGNEG